MCSLLSLYTVTSMCVFRSDHLVLDNLAVSTPLGKAVSPTSNIPGLPTVACVQLKPHEFSLSLSIAIALVQLLARQACWPDFVDVDSDITRIHNLTANSLSLTVTTPTPRTCYAVVFIFFSLMT